MKILCLHGKGTSARIFESQTQSFRTHLPPYYAYDFLPGEVPMNTYKEISDFFPGPYLCYHEVNTMEAVGDVFGWVGGVVEDEGPFDGVMGFSQGAVILYHQIHHPFSPPLFRFAIFICGGAPFSCTPSHGADVTELYIKDGVMHGDIMHESHADEVEERPSSADTPEEAFGSTVRRFNAKVDKERLEIPTAHIYGANDVDVRKSEKLVELCEEKVRYTYVHQGGHNIPRGEETSRGIADVVRKVVARSEMAS
ncbi:hypothetical protein ACLMJK_007637 [Lecanora helva]